MFENDRLDWKHTFLPSPNGNLEEMKRLFRYHMIILTYFCVFMWLEFIFSDCRFGIYLANLEFIWQIWNLSHRVGIYVYGILSDCLSRYSIIAPLPGLRPGVSPRVQSSNLKLLQNSSKTMKSIAPGIAPATFFHTKWGKNLKNQGFELVEQLKLIGWGSYSQDMFRAWVLSILRVSSPSDNFLNLFWSH